MVPPFPSFGQARWHPMPYLPIAASREETKPVLPHLMNQFFEGRPGKMASNAIFTYCCFQGGDETSASSLNESIFRRKTPCYSPPPSLSSLAISRHYQGIAYDTGADKTYLNYEFTSQRDEGCIGKAPAVPHALVRDRFWSSSEKLPGSMPSHDPPSSE